MSQQVPNATLEDAIFDWVSSASGLGDTKVIWEQQDAPRPAAPYVSLHLAVVDPVGPDWTARAENPLTFTAKTIEGVAGDTVLITAHGLATGDGPIELTHTGAGALPAPLALSTPYWWIRIDADHGRFATTHYKANHGTNVTLTDVGGGTMKVNATADTRRAGAEVNSYARGLRRCRLVLQCFAAAATGTAAAAGILNDVISKARLPIRRAALRDAGVGLPSFESVNSLGGALNSAHFEPRATTECVFFAASEAVEAGTYIEFARVTQQVEDLADVTLYIPEDPAAG